MSPHVVEPRPVRTVAELAAAIDEREDVVQAFLHEWLQVGIVERANGSYRLTQGAFQVFGQALGVARPDDPVELGAEDVERLTEELPELRPEQEERACEACGRSFAPKASSQRACTTPCRKRAWRKRRREREEVPA